MNFNLILKTFTLKLDCFKNDIIKLEDETPQGVTILIEYILIN